MKFLVGDRQYPIRPGISSEPDVEIVPRSKGNPLYILEIDSIERFVELTQKYDAHYISKISHVDELPSGVVWQIVHVS